MRDEAEQQEASNYAPLGHQGRAGARWSLDGNETGAVGWLHVLAPLTNEWNATWQAAWVDHEFLRNSGTAEATTFAGLHDAAQANGCPWMEALHKCGTWVLARHWRHPSADSDVVVQP